MCTWCSCNPYLLFFVIPPVSRMTVFEQNSDNNGLNLDISLTLYSQFVRCNDLHHITPVAIVEIEQ